MKTANQSNYGYACVCSFSCTCISRSQDRVLHNYSRPDPYTMQVNQLLRSSTALFMAIRFDHVLASSTTDHVSSGSAELRPRRERLRQAPTTSTTRLRRHDDRREERCYDNRDHSRDDKSESSRTGQLHRQRHVKPSLEHRNTPTTPTGRQ